MNRPLAINLTLITLAALVGGFASLRPWKGYAEQREETLKQQRAMKAFEKQRADLLREDAHDNSAVGKEERARALGYIRPGQRPAEPQSP